MKKPTPTANNTSPWSASTDTTLTPAQARTIKRRARNYIVSDARHMHELSREELMRELMNEMDAIEGLCGLIHFRRD